MTTSEVDLTGDLLERVAAQLGVAPSADLVELISLQVLRQQEGKARRLSKGAADYVNDPLGFIDKYVRFPGKQQLAEYQREIIGSIPGHQRAAVRGPRGLGKSTTAALVILWFALTRDAAGIDWKVMTTAGSWAQLKNYLWPEIHKWARRVDWKALGRAPLNTRNELLNTEMHLSYGNVSAASPKDSAKLEGLHADHVLVVVDEAKIVPAAMFDSAEGSFSAVGDDEDEDGGLQAFALAISTPGEPSGRFYDIHRQAPGLEDWHPRHVTLDEAIAARRMTRKWAEQRRKMWGESSALYQNHVLGEFCASDEEAVIPLKLVEEAIARWRGWDNDGRPDMGDYGIGVDVARSGLDKTILAHGTGQVIIRLEEQAKADTMVTAGVVRAALDARPGSKAVIDVIGVGAGVYDRLKEQGAPVEAFVASHKTARKDKTGHFGFVRLKDYAWWSLRERLEEDDCQIAFPDDPELLGDLTSVHWKITSTGKITVETKDEVKKRIGRSPDKGDACIMRLFENTSDWASAYNIIKCPNDNCPRGAFYRLDDNGRERVRCPWCGTSLRDDETPAEPAAAASQPSAYPAAALMGHATRQPGMQQLTQLLGRR